MAQTSYCRHGINLKIYLYSIKLPIQHITEKFNNATSLGETAAKKISHCTNEIIMLVHEKYTTSIKTRKTPTINVNAKHVKYLWCFATVAIYIPYADEYTSPKIQQTQHMRNLSIVLCIINTNERVLLGYYISTRVIIDKIGY